VFLLPDRHRPQQVILAKKVQQVPCLVYLVGFRNWK
jgi:hypothetical protein